MKLSPSQQKAKEMFQEFTQDKEAFDMFIQGTAGTGKTTLLNDIVEVCLKQQIPTVVVAYTHKAAKVLESKLPEGTDIRTLHSFLRKRPGINENAKSVQKMQITTQFGKPQEVQLLIVDEFSMVGDGDATSIGELQDPEYQGIPKMKVLYVGDPLQLPPVNAAQVIVPAGKYNAILKEVQRQAEGPLLDTILDVVKMLKSRHINIPLKENEQFHRKVNLVETFAKSNSQDKIVLAYTNKRVQTLNQEIANLVPDPGFRWSPTMRAELKDLKPQKRELINIIHTHNGTLTLDSKYRTLEHLISIADEYNIKFAKVWDLTAGENRDIAYIFGHGDFNQTMQELADRAAKSNSAINAVSPKNFCARNPHTKECRIRAKAWRDYLTIKECVMCIDYPFAQTVNKSQGSTFEEVYIDNLNLRIIKDRTLYLKYLYVAISRASNKVFLNN